MCKHSYTVRAQRCIVRAYRLKSAGQLDSARIVLGNARTWLALADLAAVNKVQA